MMRRLVIFDLDGTLIHASSERLFARYLYERGYIGARQALAFAGFVVRHAWRYRFDVFLKDKAWLAGLPRAQVDALAKQFVDERLIKTLYRPALVRLEHHQAAGDFVILLTGTPDFIATPLGERLDLAHVIAAQCAERNGVLTADPPLQHPLGAEKLHLARAFAFEQGITLRDAVAYANARGDRFLLKGVGEAVAVRPDLRLRGLARRSGWEIMEAGT
jgi:HAD superfamily hydrolase (TIGR01490 family)